MMCARRLLLAVLAGFAGFQAQAGPPADDAACRAARDRALQALASEALSLQSALDNDAAISGAPEYLLQETRDALIADIDRERAAVRERYRQCIAEKRLRPTQ